MPWVPKRELRAHILALGRTWADQEGRYEKRVKEPPGCDCRAGCDQTCECVLHGMYASYEPEYEYYIPIGHQPT